MVHLCQAVGTATTGSGNLFDLSEELSKHAKTKGTRYLHYAALTGSTAALDAAVKLVKVKTNGTQKVLGIFFNQKTTHNLVEKEMLPIMETIYPNEELQAFIINDCEAAAFLQLVIRNIPKRRGRSR